MLVFGGVTLCSCQAIEILLDSNGTCRDKENLEPRNQKLLFQLDDLLKSRKNVGGEIIQTSIGLRHHQKID